jgi:tRNA pseudouridine38-40 synthase
MTIVRLDLAYHGAEFAGWAAQPGLRTVQAELHGAIEKLTGESVSLNVAGRTDAGVHAWRQVASFELPGDPPEELGRALNALTGKDLAVLGAAPAPDGFDARRDAKSRTYCYRLLTAPVPSPFERGLALFWPYPIDRALLDRCAQALLGSHDFTAFTPTQTEHVRFEREVLRAEWLAEPPKELNPMAPQTGTPGAEGEEVPADGMPADGVPGDAVLQFWIEADAFMRNMVRVLVGTMLEVAADRRSLEDFARLLDGAPREAAGDTARAHGLYLAAVRY